MPSGLFGEDNLSNNPDSIIRAKMTLTFEFPKLAMLLPENEAYVGRWKVLPIGLHPDIIQKTPTAYLMVTDEDMERLIRPRSRFAHKGDFGHALLVAGGKGRMGAALLAASACMHSGVGKLTVHLPQRGEMVLQTAVPEAMIDLDADALNLLARNRELIPLLPPGTVLTPHPREFDRLFGESANGYDRLHKAATTAVKHAICIVLKGAYTAVCAPQGQIYFNTTGNPGMATAGSGDVLTGVIAALMAQRYDPVKAAIIGVFLHGSAGDLAAARSSEESLVASDIVHELGRAFRMQQADD